MTKSAWMWLEHALEPIFGSDWREHARQAFGFEPDVDLQHLFDFDLDEGALCGAEGLISQYLCALADEAQRKANDAAAAAESFESVCKRRRFDVELAERCKERSEIEALTDIIFEQSLADIEAA